VKTYHNNGERWYCNRMSIARRLRRHFIWIGGLEDHTGHIDPREACKSIIRRWGLGRHLPLLDRILSIVAPLSLLGHAL
jgi:hypothetical protein